MILFSDDNLNKFTLRPSSNLVDSSFALIMRYDDSPKIVENSLNLAEKYANCFYSNENSAFDLCDDENIRGIIRNNRNKTNIVIHPLPSRFGTNSHIIMHREMLDDDLQENQVFEPEMSRYEYRTLSLNQNPYNSSSYVPRYRPKRQISSNSKNNVQSNIPNVLHIETAIFVDKDLFRHMRKNFPVNTESHLIRFVLAMINGVQLLYHHPSLGKQVNFILKRLEILHTEPKDLRRASDIDIYLNSFCSWQRKLNPASDADVVHFDHAVILTGLDLYVVGKNGKVSSQVVGLAPVAGMCSAVSSCTINEGKHFESVFVVAHEIGHNLGMRHDSSESNCDPSLYIMSPTLGSGKITWSQCSANYLNNFLRSSQATCLFDRGQFGPSLDHSAEGLLPGQRFDADTQCMLKYGRDSVRSPTQAFNDICRDLHCQRSRYTWTSHPALEGTSCGIGMWCQSGVCVPRLKSASSPYSSTSNATPSSLMHAGAEKLIQLDDNAHLAQHLDNLASHSNKIAIWSDWGEGSECESGCLYGESGRLKEGSTGLRIYQRTCGDYGGSRSDCKGSDKKFETCMPSHCYSVQRTTVLDFANEVCIRAKEFDPDLTGNGIQQVANPEESCLVFCETRTLKPKSKSWIFPDGTTCRNKNSDFDDSFYCINGRCEKFTCENSTENYFKIESDFCPQSLVFEQSKEKEQNLNTLQENGRDFKSLKLTTKKPDEKSPEINATTDNSKSDSLQTLRYVAAASVPSSNQEPYNSRRNSEAPQALPYTTNSMHHTDKLELQKHKNRKSNEWTAKSGCHFSCMENARGLQLVESVHDSGSKNIQLCSPDLVPCDRIQTTFEYATKLCTKYRAKVRGLSGTGTQIAASIHDPDRSCKVACQDGYMTHRFYLVNGEQGFFPFGTKCSKTDERYCVSGKCLQFGDDDIPLNESYNNMINLRNKRDLRTKKSLRFKRHYLYYAPINITERITRDFLNNLIAKIDFNLSKDFDNISEEHIDFQDPVDYSLVEQR
uniref:CSON014126 protein n=1 Tax=Culicoides sonorensis TaxID=179676 RepID=A0A336KUH1_CULSO